LVFLKCSIEDIIPWCTTVEKRREFCVTHSDLAVVDSGGFDTATNLFCFFSTWGLAMFIEPQHQLGVVFDFCVWFVNHMTR
jgi:hypothetical protein